jgi:co-chaperonin GroES (HSP10)
MQFQTKVREVESPTDKSTAMIDVDATISRAQALMAPPQPDEDGDVHASTLPTPTGYRMLVMMPKVAEKTDGGIIRPDDFRAREEVASTLCFVLAMGPDAYADQKKFPNGPWCKTGDFILVRAYSGTRFKVGGQELRLINDDQCEAVISDPRSFSRF